MWGRKPVEQHTWVEARLSAYIDDCLAPNERAQLERHLDECAQCRASVASLRWTRDLLRQAPAPELPRSFALPVPAPRAPAPTFAFVRMATAFATLLLVVLIGADLLWQFGGAPMPSAAPMAEKLAAPTQALAFHAQPTPANAARDAAGRGASPTEAARAAEAAPSTPAPPPAALPAPAPTKAPVDTAPKSAVAAPTAPRPLLAAAPSATATLPAPTATLVPTATLAPTATATPVAPTPVPLPPSEPLREFLSPWRVVEFGLLFAVAFLGTLMLLLRRK